MKYSISAVLILSLILSTLFIPMAVTADDGKSIVKAMVQAPEDYSVGGFTNPYVIVELDRLPGYDMSRPYWWPFPFLRLFIF